jgi:hypothetical protein
VVPAGYIVVAEIKMKTGQQQKAAAGSWRFAHTALEQGIREGVTSLLEKQKAFEAAKGTLQLPVKACMLRKA